jgi:acetyl-CoA acetyltransferase
MATGIRDKVAVLGMGCSKFGERWESDAADLMVEAFAEGIKDAGIETRQIDAAWLATAIEEQHVGKSAVPLATALRLPFIPVTRVENFCASGTEAFRGAVYAVASGAADIALALGVEKLKDTGYGGLPQRGRGTLNNMIWPNLSAPGLFAQLGAAYRAKHGASRDEIDLVEVHDCFSVTELVTLEDLQLSAEGGAINDVLDGFYDAGGSIPCQIDGGLKCFGHPIGASGLRMIYEMYLQMLGRAGERQRKDLPRLGVTHNLGGFPHQNVCSVAIVGRYEG